jgi:hypothetical protein
MDKTKSQRIGFTKTVYSGSRLFMRLLIIGIFVCSIISVDAQDLTNSDNLTKSSSIVETILKELPLETVATGTIVSIESPRTPLIITTDMGNVPEQNMRTFAQDPDLFKNAIMGNFRGMGEPFISLSEAAYNAGIPFAIHLTATTFPEGFTVTFTIDDLRKGLD